MVGQGTVKITVGRRSWLNRLNIAGKIWLSIGVFVLGYVISTVFVQIKGMSTERTLSTTADALLSAVQQSHEAEAAFQRLVKAFSDSMVTQDTATLDGGVKEGGRMVGNLMTIAD